MPEPGIFFACYPEISRRAEKDRTLRQVKGYGFLKVA
jgi:hypothetical protein